MKLHEFNLVLSVNVSYVYHGDIYCRSADINCSLILLICVWKCYSECLIWELRHSVAFFSICVSRRQIDMYLLSISDDDAAESSVYQPKIRHGNNSLQWKLTSPLFRFHFEINRILNFPRRHILYWMLGLRQSEFISAFWNKAFYHLRNESILEDTNIFIYIYLYIIICTFESIIVCWINFPHENLQTKQKARIQYNKQHLQKRM